MVPMYIAKRLKTSNLYHNMSVKGYSFYARWINNALHKFIIFVGSSPTQGDIFFLKSDTKWAFLHSNTLEICLINLRGQDSLKIQKFVPKIANSRSRFIYEIYV